MSDQQNSHSQYASVPQNNSQSSSNVAPKSKFNFFDKGSTNQSEQPTGAVLNLSQGGLQKIFNTLNKQQQVHNSKKPEKNQPAFHSTTIHRRLPVQPTTELSSGIIHAERQSSHSRKKRTDVSPNTGNGAVQSQERTQNGSGGYEDNSGNRSANQRGSERRSRGDSQGMQKVPSQLQSRNPRPLEGVSNNNVGSSSLTNPLTSGRHQQQSNSYNGQPQKDHILSSKESRFATRNGKQPPHAIPQTHSLGNQRPQLNTEPNGAGNDATTAKYFSQRLMNQQRSNKAADFSKQDSSEPAEGQSSLNPKRTKEEMLRDFISPTNQNNIDAASTKIPSRNPKIGKPSHTEILDSKPIQNPVNGGLGSLSVEKINEKVFKLKSSNIVRNADSFPNYEDGKSSDKPNVSKQNPTANSFRAKLLRQQEDKQNKLNSSGHQKVKDDPPIIQQALNSLKNSLSSKDVMKKNDKEKNDNQNQSSKNEILKQAEKVDESNFGPDNIVEYRGMKMTVSQRIEYQEMEEEQITKFKHNYYPAKYASKKNGVVVTYAANTHQGMVRNYNEDRVSIILNIIKPKFKQIDYWPRCSFFAIYDGHGGAGCADFLRDQLHQLIVRDSEFPQNPIKAMKRGFEQAEKTFLEYAHNDSNLQTGNVQRSGSCAVVILIVGEVAYVANVGDSRAFMSVDGGTRIVPLSVDHKPEDPSEQKRIEDHGGKVYQNQSFIPDPTPDNAAGTQTLIGPHRVFPGRLSVSRTIGDIEAKDERYGGNPNVVIATPDIRCFRIKENFDFIVVGCDGIFEKMDNNDVMNSIWDAALKPEDLKMPLTVHARCGQAIDSVLNTTVQQKTLDNITSVIIGFNSFENIIDKARSTGTKASSLRERKETYEELELEWDAEEELIEESESHRIMQKLLKPLEPVEEELMEASDLETPLSEVIDVTRKKPGSRQLLAQSVSRTSSVSKYEDSSRRQSQLLDAQETQNVRKLLMNEDDPRVSLNTDSVRGLKRDDSSERGVLRDIGEERPQNHQESCGSLEEQAGIEQRKSAAQIGSVAASQQPSSALTQMESSNNAEYQQSSQIITSTKANGEPKDFKIRQTSASPSRKVTRQLSDRALNSKAAAQKEVAPPRKQTMFEQQQLAPPSELPLTLAGSAFSTNASQIPQKAHKGRNQSQMAVGNSSSMLPKPQQTSSKEREAMPQPKTNLTDLPATIRPVTPKRVISSNKHVAGGLVDYAPAKVAAQIGRDKETGKSSRSVKPLRAALLKDPKTEEGQPGQGRFSKQMIANWVGTQQSRGERSSAERSAQIIKILNARDADPDQPPQSRYASNPYASYQPAGVPLQSKQLAGQQTLHKTYMQGAGPAHSSSKSQGGKGRSQRIADLNGLGVPSFANEAPDPSVNQTFNSQNNLGLPQKQPLPGTKPLSKSGSNHGPRRKKSQGKPSLGGKSLRLSDLNSNQLNNVPTPSQVAGLTNQVLAENLNNQHHLPQNMKPSRTSNSRNIASHLQPSLTSNAGQHSTPGNLAGSLNLNQMNLTSQSNRHANGLPTGITNQSFNSSTGSAIQTKSFSGSQPPKMWYSNTINLTGIKQLATQSYSNQQQLMDKFGKNKTVVKRQREQN